MPIRCAAALLLALTSCAASLHADTAPLCVVRVLHRVLANDLHDALRHSATMREMVVQLERSDLIIHVIGGVPTQPGTERRSGAMQFVGAHGGRRYLRVTVDDWLEADARAAVLAHELQHALEVAQAPRVVDQASLAALYQRIGHSSCDRSHARCFETAAAQRVGLRVFSEMRRAALLMAR